MNPARNRSLRRRDFVDAVPIDRACTLPRGRRWRDCHLAAARLHAPRAGTGSLLRASPSLPRRIRARSSIAISPRGPRCGTICTRAPARTEALALLAPFHAELQAAAPALAPLWTHNDWHASNLFWSDARRQRARRRGHRLRPGRPHQRRPRPGSRDRAQHRRVARAASTIQHIPNTYPSTTIICSRCSTATNRCGRSRARSRSRWRRCWRSVTRSSRYLRPIISSACCIRKRRPRTHAKVISSRTRVGSAAPASKFLEALRAWAERENRRRGTVTRMILPAIEQFFRAHWLELAGFVTTGVGIWLTARRNLLCWPITLAADVLYLVVFYHARLLSDALLQMFFVAFTLYGWWHWWRGVREEGEVRVVPLSTRNMLLAIVAGAAGAMILGFPARRLHAALPYLDAALASFSLVGSWWQARKAHRQLVALDRGRHCLHRRIHLQGSVAHGGAVRGAGRPRHRGPSRLAASAGFRSGSRLNHVFSGSPSI